MNQENPKRILSFDIGIKNLAYCYLEETSSINQTKSYKIIDWRVIDLMTPPLSNFIISNQESSFIQKCTCSLGKKSKNSQTVICGKTAKYQKDQEFFCETHAKTKQWIIPRKNHELSWLNKQKKDSLSKIFQDTFKTSPPLGNVKKTLIDSLIKYYQENSFIKIGKNGKKGPNSKELDLITIGKHMAEHLDKYFVGDNSLVNPTHVIMENQISTMATRMKTIQGELTMYFLLRVPGVNIEYISSKNKLKGFQSSTKEESELSTSNTASAIYKKHKKDAIIFTQELLLKNKDTSSWLNYFNNEPKKKDDLADCFLQGLWYMNNKTK